MLYGPLNPFDYRPFLKMTSLDRMIQGRMLLMSELEQVHMTAIENSRLVVPPLDLLFLPH